jgi:hypothetical protein
VSHRIAPRRVTFDYVQVFKEGLPPVGDPGGPQAEAKRLAARNRAVHKGLLPSWNELGVATARFLRRSYHPSREGSLGRKVADPERFPAARAAAT